MGWMTPLRHLAAKMSVGEKPLGRAVLPGEVAGKTQSLEQQMGKFVIQPHGRLQEWIADAKGYGRPSFPLKPPLAPSSRGQGWVRLKTRTSSSQLPRTSVSANKRARTLLPHPREGHANDEDRLGCLLQAAIRWNSNLSTVSRRLPAYRVLTPRTVSVAACGFRYLASGF